MSLLGFFVKKRQYWSKTNYNTQNSVICRKYVNTFLYLCFSISHSECQCHNKRVVKFELSRDQMSDLKFQRN